MVKRAAVSLALLTIVMSILGCAKKPSQTQWEARSHRSNMAGLKVGMSKDQVLGLMGKAYRKELFRVGGTNIEVWFYRTGGKSPSDRRRRASNFTPLVFEKNVLSGWGWNYYGLARGRHTVADAPKPKGATGTCFAVSPNGVLLTAYHVVEDAKSILVHFPGGTVAQAKVETFSKKTDLAILRINFRTPYYLPLAAVRSVRVGERVFTMGYPVKNLIGQEPKVMEGAVSALSGLRGEATLLQMSVPIQPGNAGGPLVNQRGQVVGVVTFQSAAGTLPLNSNAAVKADYARPLFNVPTVQSFGVGPTTAIKLTRRAICLVEARSG